MIIEREDDKEEPLAAAEGFFNAFMFSVPCYCAAALIVSHWLKPVAAWRVEALSVVVIGVWAIVAVWAFVVRRPRPN